MPPTSAPPNFYNNIASMGQGGAPAVGKKTEDGKDPDAELMQAFAGIFKVFEKIKKLKPEAGPKLQPAYDAIKTVISDVLKKDPKEVEPAPEPPPAAPPAGETPPPPPDGDETHTA